MNIGKIDTYSLEKFMTQFNIKRKPAKRRFKIKPELADMLLRAAMMFLLLAIDFILYAGSGNISIFHGISMTTEVFMVILLLAFLSVLVFYLIIHNPFLQNILIALLTTFFIYALYNQFAQFDHKGFIAGWFDFSQDSFFASHSDSFMAVIFGILAFCFYSENKRIHIAYVTFLVFLMFFGILIHDFMDKESKEEFFISYDDMQDHVSLASDSEGAKVVYFFLPNAASYKYIASLGGSDAAQTKDIMMGFYAKNKFLLFPNAYVDHDSQYMNLIETLNSQKKSNPYDSLMKTKMLYKYWKFFNLKNEFIYLRDNDLFDTFKNSNYRITAYKSREFDICHKEHKINVNRCIEKINKPLNIYNKKMGLAERVKLIIAEWLDSTGVFGNIPGLYSALSVFSNPDETPLIGINYNNLYVVNSIKILDVLFEHISKDEGNHAYFVLLDLPADMYIYDEYCHLKPHQEWISLDPAPWVGEVDPSKKKKAYLQQTMCLYGKLEEFLQKLQAEDLENKTSVIIQGISSFEQGIKHKDIDFVTKFINSQLVTLAIKDPYSEYFNVLPNICPVKNILNNMLYGADLCKDLSGLNAHIAIKKDMLKKLKQDTGLDEEYLQKATDYFDAWFQEWRKNNGLEEKQQSDDELGLI